MAVVKKGEGMGPVDVASEGALPAFTEEPGEPFDVKQRVVDLNGAALVVLEVSTGSLLPEEVSEYLNEMNEHFLPGLQKEVKEATGRTVPIVMAASPLNIRTLDAAEMRAAGWVRASEEE